MFPGGDKANTNVYVDSIYREARMTEFIDTLEFQTASGRISTIKRNAFTALITRPVLDETAFTVARASANQCEIPLTSHAVVTDESIQMDTTLSASYELCQVEQAYIVPNIEIEAAKITDKQIRYEIDTYVIDTAIAQAGHAIAAVTDQATAEAAIDAVDELFTGYVNLEGDVKVIVPASLKRYFKHLISDRITVLGDKVFLSGNLSMINGMEFIFIQDAHLTNPAQVLFVAGKPVGLWIDQAGFMSGKRDSLPSAGNVVNLNEVFFTQLNMKAHVWTALRNRIVVAG